MEKKYVNTHTHRRTYWRERNEIRTWRRKKNKAHVHVTDIRKHRFGFPSATRCVHEKATPIYRHLHRLHPSFLLIHPWCSNLHADTNRIDRGMERVYGGRLAPKAGGGIKKEEREEGRQDRKKKASIQECEKSERLKAPKGKRWDERDIKTGLKEWDEDNCRGMCFCQ